jgi:LuxR family maltose regulon positive regulatory protein
MVHQARERLAALDELQVATGPVRNAAAVIRLAEHDPAAARRELRTVLDGAAPGSHGPTLVEAHLLDALAGHALGEQRATWQGLEQALQYAEPDRLILPFTATGAWRLLETLPPQRTSHAPLVADILNAVHGRTTANPEHPAQTPIEALSPSELRVLRYLPTHLTRPEIAGELSVSLNTISTHIRRIYAKLDVADRFSAVQRGRELRLISTGRV